MKRRVKGGDEEGGEMGRVREREHVACMAARYCRVCLFTVSCSLENQRLCNLHVPEQCISQTYISGVRAVQQSVDTCTSRVLSVT